MFLTLDGVRYPAQPTSTTLWLLNGVESGPGPGPGPGPGDQTFEWPFDPTSEVTSEYGPRDGRIHQGIDFGKGRAVQGADIYASAGGKVTVATTGHSNQDGSGWGNYVIIDHGVIGGRQLFTLYGHMLAPGALVTVGQDVAKMQVLGKVNNTGNSFGSHLHWETHIANPGGSPTWSNPGTHVNPRSFMATYDNVAPADPVLEGY